MPPNQDLEAPPAVEQVPESNNISSSSRDTRTRQRRDSIRETIARIIIKDKQINDERRNSSFLIPDFLGAGIKLPSNEDDFDMWRRYDRDDEERCKNRPWYIILHNQKGRLTWDAVVATILCLMAFYVPYRVCFFWEQEDEDAKSILIFESVIDLIFLVDICLNFITSYRCGDSLVTRPRKIALHYLRGYFFIDLIATIPFGYILTSSSLSVANKLGKLGRLPKLVKFVRAARLLKLLRVYRLHDFIMKLEVEYNIHHGYSRMIKIVTLILLVTHMVGCFWFLIGILDGGESKGWVHRYELYASPRWKQYIASMYWAFSTLTTVGYGDINARTALEQSFSMVMMLVGVTWYAFIVSSMSSIMSSFDANNKALRDKMLCVNEFIRSAKLPRDLAVQIRSFFDYKTKSKQYVSNNYNVDELLGELNSGLRADILMHLERHLIDKIPFLKNKVPQFVADCVSMFSPMVFSEGDFIVREGTQADEMYFLTRGTAGVFYGSKLAAVVNEGSYFGEVGCIMGGIRRASVKALTQTELQALSRRNLNMLLAEYPAVAEEMKQVARDRASLASSSSSSKSSSSRSRSDADESNGKAISKPSSTTTSSNDDSALDAEIESMVEAITSKFRQKLRKTSEEKK